MSASSSAAGRPPPPKPHPIHGWDNFQDVYEAEPPAVLDLAPSRVVGRLPPDLRGVFYRNGPGLSTVYGAKLNHYIDGDGLVVAVRFSSAGTGSEEGQSSKSSSSSGVTLSARFVDTLTHQVEREQRKLVFPGQMGTKPEGWQERVEKALQKGDRDALKSLFTWRDMARKILIVVYNEGRVDYKSVVRGNWLREQEFVGWEKQDVECCLILRKTCMMCRGCVCEEGLCLMYVNNSFSSVQPCHVHVVPSAA